MKCNLPCLLKGNQIKNIHFLISRIMKKHQIDCFYLRDTYNLGFELSQRIIKKPYTERQANSLLVREEGHSGFAWKPKKFESL